MFFVLFGRSASAQDAPAMIISANEERLAEIQAAIKAAATPAPPQQAAIAVIETSQAAAVRIADAAQPEKILVDPLECLERAKKVFEGDVKAADKAAKYCRDLFHSGGKIVEKVANEAADGIGNIPSPAVVPTYPFGFGGAVGNSSAGYINPAVSYR